MTDGFWMYFFGFLATFVTSLCSLIASLKNRKSISNVISKVDETNKQVNGRMGELIKSNSESVPQNVVNNIIDKAKIDTNSSGL